MAVFPEGAANKIEVAYSSIDSVQEIGNKFNGEIVQIKAKDGSFNTLYIQGNGFESPFHYSEFLKILNIHIELHRSK
jgi:hypothetical protein